MVFREAIISDIPQMQIVRGAVHENKLSDPSVVKDDDYVPFLTENGKGWVCVANNCVIGFAIVDTVNSNIWALFVSPEDEGAGIGQRLQKRMLDWYFENYKETLWLGTAPGTRAESFYKKSGWKESGIVNGKEMKFEMAKADWMK